MELEIGKNLSDLLAGGNVPWLLYLLDLAGDEGGSMKTVLMTPDERAQGILTRLGYATHPSMEPGSDERRDWIANTIGLAENDALERAATEADYYACTSAVARIIAREVRAFKHRGVE